jgi:hypothetical protein
VIQPAELHSATQATPDLQRLAEDLETTGGPQIVELDGHPRAVLVEIGAFDRIARLAHRAEAWESIREGLRDVDEGLTIPLGELGAVLRRRLRLAPAEPSNGGSNCAVHLSMEAVEEVTSFAVRQETPDAKEGWIAVSDALGHLTRQTAQSLVLHRDDRTGRQIRFLVVAGYQAFFTVRAEGIFVLHLGEPFRRVAVGGSKERR